VGLGRTGCFDRLRLMIRKWGTTLARMLALACASNSRVFPLSKSKCPVDGALSRSKHFGAIKVDA